MPYLSVEIDLWQNVTAMFRMPRLVVQLAAWTSVFLATWLLLGQFVVSVWLFWPSNEFIADTMQFGWHALGPAFATVVIVIMYAEFTIRLPLITSCSSHCTFCFRSCARLRLCYITSVKVHAYIDLQAFGLQLLGYSIGVFQWDEATHYARHYVRYLFPHFVPNCRGRHRLRKLRLSDPRFQIWLAFNTRRCKTSFKRFVAMICV